MAHQSISRKHANIWLKRTNSRKAGCQSKSWLPRATALFGKKVVGQGQTRNTAHNAHHTAHVGLCFFFLLFLIRPTSVPSALVAESVQCARCVVIFATAAMNPSQVCFAAAAMLLQAACMWTSASAYPHRPPKPWGYGFDFKYSTNVEYSPYVWVGGRPTGVV